MSCNSDSLTKYIGGHGTSIGGIIVDGGNFDWTKDRKRQPLLNEPDQSYNGAIWEMLYPNWANIPYVVRARVVLLRDLERLCLHLMHFKLSRFGNGCSQNETTL